MLPRRDPLQRILAPVATQELRHDRRIDRRAALADSPNGGRELLHVADAILEQIAHPLRRVGEQLHRQAELEVLREHEHAHRGIANPNLLRGTQPLVGVRRGQPNVDDHDLRRIAAHLEEEILGGGALADDLESGLGQEPRQ